MSDVSYRRDIDGLRAVAVLAVVAYHVDDNFLPGGFSGVDVFFVISGYLISGLALRALGTDSWSFASFYQRRIRRLFPALVVVMSAVWLFGWFSLFAGEYAQLGKHISAAAIFLANVLNYREAGYFDTTIELKPLVHLWSLAVEEQFYVFWPVLLVFAWRRTFDIAVVGALACALSFSYNVASVGSYPVSTFFLPGARMWELLCGAVYAAMELRGTGNGANGRAVLSASTSDSARRFANGRAVAGLALIVLGFFVIDRERAFPGWWALFPVAGTVLLLSAGPASWVNFRILGSRALVAVGLISYPLYLWHWPLLSYARIIESGNPAAWVLGVAVATSFLLAWMTYQFVERPFRYGARPVLKTSILIVLMVIVGSAGGVTWARKGLPWRAAVSDITTVTGWKSAEGRSEGGCPIPIKHRDLGFFCFRDLRSPTRFVVIGDSHAHSIYPGLLAASQEGEGWSLIGKPAFVPFRGLAWKPHASFATTQFAAAREAALAAIESDPAISLVLIVQASRVLNNEEYYQKPEGEVSLEDWMYDAASSTITELEAAGKRVAFLIDNPRITDYPEDCVRKRPFQSLAAGAVCSLPRSQYEESIRGYRRLVQRLAASHPRLLVYDPTDLLCDSDACDVVKDGQALYYFTDHLSDAGSELVATGLMTYLRQAGVTGGIGAETVGAEGE